MQKISPTDHALIREAAKLPVSTPTPVISISPIILSAPGRLVDLQIRISAPATGSDLPIILLSHGHGQSNHLSSLKGYSPLVDFWAAHGFVVIQPTHLSSKSLGLPATTPGAPLFWRSRAEDFKRILDQLDNIEAAVPVIQGRLDRNRIAVAGHSMGGHTASMLLGTRLNFPDGEPNSEAGTVMEESVDLSEPRIKAGVLLTAPGSGGDSLSDFAAEHYSFFKHPSFTTMTTPALVVVGDADNNPYLTTRGADWHVDPYTLSPGPKSLLTFCGAGHGLGGIAGYDVAETTDENVERVAAVQRLTWAYLRSALYPDDDAWSAVCKVFAGLPTLGSVVSK